MKLFHSSTSARQLWHMLNPKDRLVILAAMATTATVGFSDVPLIQTLLLSLLGGSAVIISLCDLRHRIIPDLISMLLMATGIGFNAAHGFEMLLSHLVTAALVTALLLALRAGHFRLRRRIGLGLGDIKLIAVAAVWIGPLYLPNYILLCALSALGHAYLTRSDPDPRGIPFGVSLALWLWGFGFFLAFSASDLSLHN